MTAITTTALVPTQPAFSDAERLGSSARPRAALGSQRSSRRTRSDMRSSPPRSMPGSVSDWNTKIIEEFRANGGAVGGQFAGAPLLLLHTVGARSGQRRVNPVMYQKVDGGYAVFASKAGAPVSPDWYHNLLAQPQVTAEIGTRTVELVARVADGDERERIWAAQKAAYPGFADYERKTTRQIPVIVLEPARL
jgi:deazaflavin-dependent oxidoreductase (nitroreductase family)